MSERKTALDKGNSKKACYPFRFERSLEWRLHTWRGGCYSVAYIPVE